MFLKSAQQLVTQSKRLQAPQTWQDLEQGLWWRQSLRDWLQEQDPIVFGQYMLTCSGLDVPWLDARIKAQYKIHPGSQADVRAHLTALPIAADSIDWAALPFVLEYSADPHQILREVDRTLRTDGCMLITMSNPYGLHSLARLWPAWRKKKPWQSRLFTPARVLDWLSLLNYQVIHQGYFGYGVPWPSRSGKATANLSVIRRFPWMAAGFAVIVRKREWPLTMVRQEQYQRHRVTEKGVVPAGRIRS
ncbi:MAG TPA: methyltransferase domain-containing protein [Aliidiomarina sp.]|nr:methyltransferase domain-containing protein [Aliidiomarina sp.]